MARLLHILFALLVFGPVALWLAAFAATLVLANRFDCAISEGAVRPCIVAGADWGEAAYTLAMFAAWGPLMLAPMVIGAAALWMLFMLLRAVLRRRA